MRRPLLALFLVVPAAALAMEGHWRPAQMPELGPELKEMGLKIPPAQLADPKGHPLGAVVDMDYCSGAFVSPDGLIATAYHCVTDGLQFASGKGEDLMERGFRAADRAQERWAGPDQQVRVTTSMTPVTDKVLAGTARLNGTDRLARIDANSKQLVRKCETGPDIHCRVATYGGGASYELISQLELRDVRLVYAPPRSVGYFGGDVENWRWPRHSGDFAFLRAYVSPDGKSTSYHPGNVPYHPPVWLPVAQQGVEPGDFVMVAGYPEGTYRWRSAAEVDYAQEEALPLRVTERTDLLAILHEWTTKDPSLASKLAPRRLNWSNDLIYYKGTLDQLQRTGADKERWAFEHELSKWIAANPDRAVKYGTVLDRIHTLQAEQAATAERDYLVQQMVQEVDLLHAATTIWKLAVEADKPDKDRAAGYQNRDRPSLAASMDQVDSTFDFRVDRDLLRYFLLRLARLPEGDRIPELSNWLGAGPKDDLEEVVDARLDTLYQDTSLADSDQRRDLMGTNTFYLKHSENPWFALAAALQPFLDRMHAEQRRREAEWRIERPLYIQAVQAFYPTARPRYLLASRRIAPGIFYPDANSTLRISVGKVDGYYPRDGLIAAPQTTVDGLLAEVGPKPFDAPEKLVKAIQSGQGGPWVDPKLGKVPVDFLTTLDTARGSSGSATMNAKGEFVGIIFDGNYESIASDWMFDPATTRSIHTDVRFILWYLDRVAGDASLLKELGVTPHFATTAKAAE